MAKQKQLTEKIKENIVESIINCATMDMKTFCNNAGVAVTDFVRWQQESESFRNAVSFAYSLKMQHLEQRKKFLTLKLHEKVLTLAEERLDEKTYIETKSIFKEIKTTNHEGKEVYVPRLVAKQTTEKKRFPSDKLLEQALPNVLPEVFHPLTVKPRPFTPPSLFSLINEADLIEGSTQNHEYHITMNLGDIKPPPPPSTIEDPKESTQE